MQDTATTNLLRSCAQLMSCGQAASAYARLSAALHNTSDPQDQIRIRLQLLACCLKLDDPDTGLMHGHALLDSGYRDRKVLQAVHLFALRNQRWVLAARMQFELACAETTRQEPDSEVAAIARMVLAQALEQDGQFAESLMHYVRLQDSVHHSALSRYRCILIKRQLCDWSDWDADNHWLKQQVESGQPCINPYLLMTADPFTPQDILACAINFAAPQVKAVARPLHPVAPLQPVSAGMMANRVADMMIDTGPTDPPVHSVHGTHAAPSPPHYRVAFLSHDFRSHAVAHLLLPFLEALAARHPQRIHTLLYCTHPPIEQDPMHQRCRQACEQFRYLHDCDDRQAALWIAHDQPDLLIDLQGHTRGARPGILAWRPAPLQLSWLGYPGTLGHRQLADGIIGDRVVTPMDCASHYTETLIQLSGCYQPGPTPDTFRTQDSNANLTPVSDRLRWGLPDGRVVLGAFNQLYKLTPRRLALWCTLLKLQPDSVLWMLEPDMAQARNHLLTALNSNGIGPERIIWAPRVGAQEHIRRLALADLGLDTFPYTSHTTARDLLIAGVPIVTLCGDTMASRVCASLLNSLSLQNLIAHDEQEWLDKNSTLIRNKSERHRTAALIAQSVSQSITFKPQSMVDEFERLCQRLIVQR